MRSWLVVPADAVVDRDEHLVTGTLLPMPAGWADSVFIRPKNPSAAALSGEQPFAPVDRVRP